MENPKELKYTKTDEWVKLEGDLAIVGITNYAQEQLSDIVYVEFMAEEGDSVSKGDAVATVESVKAAADVQFPVSGTIAAVNEELVDAPETLNTDPYDTGWMMKLKFDDPAELEDLLDAQAYDAYNEEREG
ncbi:MAG: glycine cleavage system protein GcvH [Chloroflexota bacterium]|nr:glycine cleavage system protein GcvH [Chloroflexota bacterium]